jgi:folate-binding protein YgfZ
MARTALCDILVKTGARTGNFAGAETIASFGDPAAELAALRGRAGAFDLGWRGMLVITGDDRVRWLNGMVTNNTRDLPVNHGNYSLLLNAQGRIQGDLMAYNRGEYYVVTTDVAQLEKITGIFDNYIIMDDVEVTNVSDKLTSVGLAGPNSRDVLTKAGFPQASSKPGEVVDLKWQGLGVSVVRGLGEFGESYEIWIHPDNAAKLWDALVSAGAAPVGYEALEWLRMLNGVPRFGIDMTERYLPQETGQDRALHFAKGCYLGQEIVERIRSRAQLHRTLTGFEVQGAPPAAGEAVNSGDKKVGEITSSTEIPLDGAKKTIALGYIRVEANTPGNQVRVGEADARVASLPFHI